MLTDIKLGLHRISNPDPKNFAISLHRESFLLLVELERLLIHGLVYTPPNAAKVGFCLYDEKTGKAKHIKQTHFYSVRGKRLDYGQH